MTYTPCSWPLAQGKTVSRPPLWPPVSLRSLHECSVLLEALYTTSRWPVSASSFRLKSPLLDRMDRKSETKLFWKWLQVFDSRVSGKLSSAPGWTRTGDPLLRRCAIQKSKCRFWCQLQGNAPFISLLNWTENGLKCRLDLNCVR